MSKIKQFEAKVVTSTFARWDDDLPLLSMRDRDGSGSGFKKGLQAAGFKPGENVVIVPADQFDRIMADYLRAEAEREASRNRFGSD